MHKVISRDFHNAHLLFQAVRRIIGTLQILKTSLLTITLYYIKLNFHSIHGPHYIIEKLRTPKTDILEVSARKGIHKVLYIRGGGHRPD